MRDDGSARHGADYCDDASDIEKQSVGDRQNISLQEDLAQNSDEAVVTIVVSKGESYNAVGVKLKPAGKSSEGVHCIGDVADDMSISPKKAHLSRYTSSHEECRVCQQEKDENLIDLGCQCRGGLSKAHKSCINMWFRTRGSNKCEICQQVAVNVACPESHQAHTSYWVWMVDPAVRGSTIAQEHGRGCFSPLWVAFSILIGALLLDVLISITLGVSVLPVNIIIGVIVVLGLGTALRLALEFCHEWSVRRVVHRVEANVHLGYHPAL